MFEPMMMVRSRGRLNAWAASVVMCVFAMNSRLRHIAITRFGPGLMSIVDRK